MIGAQTRVAPGVQLFAFNHGIDAAAFVKDQPVVSDGIVIGEDAWIGANVCVTDGVRIGDLRGRGHGRGCYEGCSRLGRRRRKPGARHRGQANLEAGEERLGTTRSPRDSAMLAA